MFDGPEDYHARIDDPAENIDEHTILFMRGAGPVGYPGGAEVVNMQPPAYLIKRGIHALPCVGDGRQSGTSGLAPRSSTPRRKPPPAAAWRWCAPATLSASTSGRGNRQHPHLGRGAPASAGPRFNGNGGYLTTPSTQTPWQEIQRGMVDQFSAGMVLEAGRVKYQGRGAQARRASRQPLSVGRRLPLPASSAKLHFGSWIFAI